MAGVLLVVFLLIEAYAYREKYAAPKSGGGY